MAEFLLLRKPKVQKDVPKEDIITFTGLNAETKKVPKKPDIQQLSSAAISQTGTIPGIDSRSGIIGPANSLEMSHHLKHRPLYEEPPLINLLDLATVAPKHAPAFTLNDFVNDAMRSTTIENNLEAPLKSRENFNTFHSVPNGVGWVKKEQIDKLPILHVQDVINEFHVPEREQQRIPKQQKLIEMRAMIRETLQSTENGSEQSLSLLETPSDLYEHPYPNTNALFCGGLARFFQGEPRSNSPFVLPDDHIMTVSKTAVFNALRDGGKKLSLRAHFIVHVPDITPISLTLIDLNLSFNNFKSMPTQVLHLPNLLSLSMRNNPIIQLPTDMSGLPRLKELNLSFCLIHHIPDGFFSMEQIEELNMSYNHLTLVPNSIVKLHTLQALNLDGNQLPSLPFSVLGLHKLQTLFVKNNFMSSVLWSEYSSKTPLKLKDMCAKLVVDFEVEYQPYCTDELSAWIESSTFTCECCGGNMVGEGLIITRSVMERTFGVRKLPLSFRSCSHSCFKEYKKMKNLDVGEGSQSSLQGMTLQQLTMLEQ